MTLTAEEVGVAVKEYLIKNGFKPSGSLSFDYGSRLEGYGQSEHDVPYFDGCTVEVETPTPKS